MDTVRVTAVFSLAFLAGMIIFDLYSKPLIIYPLGSGVLEKVLSGYLLALVFTGYFFRPRLRDAYEYFRSRLNELRALEMPVIAGFIRDTERAKTYIMASMIFLVHFWLQWRYTYRYVHRAGGHAIIQTLNAFVVDGPAGILNYGFQINNYTGNPVFLLPLIDLFSFSPASVRIALIASFAASSAIFFIIYRRLFGFENAVLGALILFNFSEYIYFRWFDYSYVLFLVSILFYIFVRWRETQNSISSPFMHLLSFTGGIFFYFKSTVLYFLAGLAASIAYLEGRSVVDRELFLLVMVFLVGAAPFVIYNLVHFDTINDSPVGSTDVEIAGPSQMSLGDAIVSRFDQLGRWLQPDIQKLYDKVVGSDRIRTFQKDGRSAPGIELSEPISIKSMITGENYEVNSFTGFNISSVLLVVSILSLAAFRKYLEFVIFFTVFFVLMIFLPSTSGFRMTHMHILVPFVPLIYLSALDIIPEKIEESSAYSIVYLLFAGLLLGSSLFTLSLIEPAQDGMNAAELDVWAGSQDFYESYQDLEPGEQVITNSYRIAVMTTYTKGEMKSWYIIPENISRGQLEQLPQTGGHPTGTGDRTESSDRIIAKPIPLDKAGYYGGYTLILREELPCSRGEFCGAGTPKVMEELGLSYEELEKEKIGNMTYLVRHNLGETGG